MQWRVTLGLGALALAACGDPMVDRPDGGIFIPLDARVDPPPKPVLDPVPERIPYDVVTITGRSEGARVFVEGIGSTVSEEILPIGDFCVDVRLQVPGEYTFRVFAQELSGPISEATDPVTFTYDPNAPEIPGAQTCSGANPAGCSSEIEICGNMIDDDCNGLTDDRDPTCTTCQDDLFEDNDDPGAPRIELGRHDNLQICPNDPDYYGVALEAMDVLDATIFFSHREGNLDLELLAPNRETVVARSASLDEDEMITYTATTSGEYKVVVFSGDGAANAYTLELSIR